MLTSLRKLIKLGFRYHTKVTFQLVRRLSLDLRERQGQSWVVQWVEVISLPILKDPLRRYSVIVIMMQLCRLQFGHLHRVSWHHLLLSHLVIRRLNFRACISILLHSLHHRLGKYLGECLLGLLFSIIVVN
jgi:hypothetical protein